MQAFVDGDRAAFDELVSRYERRVYAVCYRYFGNAEDAEDAAQEAFIALLRRGETFAGTSSFSTWMFRVATNACNDLARKRARRPQRSDEDVALREDLAGATGSIEDELASRGLPEHLVLALRTLDDDTREAVVLHDVYHVPYHEIAERAGVAVGTVAASGLARHAALSLFRERSCDRTAYGNCGRHSQTAWHLLARWSDRADVPAHRCSAAALRRGLCAANSSWRTFASADARAGEAVGQCAAPLAPHRRAVITGSRP